MFLLIGDGCVSRHFQSYFQNLNLTFKVWSRQNSRNELEKLANLSTHVLCLISDRAIEPFLNAHSELFRGKVVVHFSGALTTPLAIGAHPLMTFARDGVYDQAAYKEIPFVVEQSEMEFQEILPGLPNPCFTIQAQNKTLYHALCVLSGNFTTMLWQKAFRDFERKLDLPKEILFPYLQQTVNNLMNRPESALTGPLARKDWATIDKHLQELKDDAFLDVYRGFLSSQVGEINEVSS